MSWTAAVPAHEGANKAVDQQRRDEEQLWCPKIIALATRPEVMKVDAADDRGYQLQRGNHTLAPSQLRG
eukprot:8467035-Karenia_brevis.AAC.1